MQQKVTAQIGATQISIETGRIARLADGALVVSCGDTTQLVGNPQDTDRAQSDLDLVYVGTENDVIMIEGSANELPEAEFVKALEFAHGHAREMIRIQKELAAKAGKPKRQVPLLQVNQDLLDIAYRVAGDRIEAALYTEGKVARAKAVDALREEVKMSILEKQPEADPFAISQAFDYVQKKAFRISILSKQKRVDGRGYQDLRPISCEVSVLPRAHGSAIFQRGETQAVALATLAPIEEAQMIDAYGGGEQSKRFILHYNFPPFSVGETGRTGGPGRREIGHGALAERSLEPIVPSENDFRYAIRISSEIMESNGSTSMASVCAGTLALMDAGVPVKTPVSGISIGLVTERGDDQALKRYELLTDIIGSEDHFGDMDFKLCGTDNGITGYQLDLKLPGISHKIVAEAIQRAKEEIGRASCR